MKTPIILKTTYGRFMRTAPRSEIAPCSSLLRVRFRAKGTPLGRYMSGKVSHYSTDYLHASTMGYAAERGRFPQVRSIDQEFIDQIAAIDDQIDELDRQRRELIEDAYLRGRPITVAQAKEWFTIKQTDAAEPTSPSAGEVNQ